MEVAGVPRELWFQTFVSFVHLGAGGSAGLQPLRPQTPGLLGFNRQRQVPVPDPALMGPSQGLPTHQAFTHSTFPFSVFLLFAALGLKPKALHMPEPPVSMSSTLRAVRAPFPDETVGAANSGKHPRGGYQVPMMQCSSHPT